MKKTLLILLSFCAAACSKKLQVDAPDFNVSLDPSRQVADTFVYRLGDSTRFLFRGTVGNIAFYSGEAGKRYDSRVITYKLGKIMLSFSSKSEFGAQTNTLQVLATNKIPGTDSASMVNAAWKDISSRGKLATSSTVVAFGGADLTDLVSNANDSLFIALKYTGVTGTTQRTWTITDFTVNNVLADRSVVLTSLSNDVAYWTRFGNVWNPANGRWTPSASDLKITGGNETAASNTSWIITKPLYVGRIAPDVSAGVKSINEPDKQEYVYAYPTPGVYRATFVAYNHTLDEEKTTIREFTIKVIP
ncbi:DUF5017 domain-containing protein [Chitinophaga qingshengii]|uniref:DUF5017 domain-containing protein n=1 Tax=Chitinophaga qingshengii TaxID=1569794 RepID=A0ABR7TMU7_9BACT|nr:DUF5017 domain-containing protein [Chitinophaga qingshengii]MBC9931807.1 DUF5017 domain-containing protein [Chitinophaga qingshengii]